MRRMSFSLTTPQFMDGSKSVTRRMGWRFLKAGDHLLAIEKGMGLKKGEKQKVLGEIVVVSVRREVLYAITREDVAREGFPDMSRAQFVEMFCKANRCGMGSAVTRIEFQHVEELT